VERLAVLRTRPGEPARRLYQAQRLDLYWEGRGQLDATGSFQLTKALNLFVEGKNLTNTAGVRYFGERQRVYEYEKFGYTIFGGVRVKL
jgi:outer membrane receptor protein involved in Fe transport